MNGTVDVDSFEESDDTRDGVSISVDERSRELSAIMLLDRLQHVVDGRRVLHVEYVGRGFPANLTSAEIDDGRAKGASFSHAG